MAELDGAGNVVARFVYAEGVNAPELMVTPTATFRLVRDHLGSVREVVDAATNLAAQQLEYDAWGRVLVDTNPGFQPFGFAGGLYDPDTGLVRFGARGYDAESGRWAAKDPIGFDGGANMFAYVGSSPVTFFDPTGLVVQICHGRPRTWPLSWLPFPHQWIKTDSKQAGQEGDSWTDTSIEDHDWIADNFYPDHTCEVVPNIDEACVDEKLVIGDPQGTWLPLVNDCGSIAWGIIYQCRLPPDDFDVCDAEPAACPY